MVMMIVMMMVLMMVQRVLTSTSHIYPKQLIVLGWRVVSKNKHLVYDKDNGVDNGDDDSVDGDDDSADDSVEGADKYFTRLQKQLIVVGWRE
eukprot:1982067-Ditylum_brightwellii.AAC.1